MKLHKTIRYSIYCILAVALSLGLAGCRESGNQEKSARLPNFLFIMADDLGYADLGCYGSTWAQTPNLDKLAEEGIMFTRFYASSGVCTPTRAAVLTGRYPLRFNITHHFSNPGQFLTDSSVTLPELLSDENYYSATIGKWHLGGIDSASINSRNRGNTVIPGPLEHGFDYYLGALRGKLKVERRLFKDAGKGLIENDNYLEPDTAHWTDININYAIKAIENSREEKRPFFVNLWFDTPHTPYEPAPEPYYSNYQGEIPDPENGHYNKANQKGDGDFYYSMIEHMDAGIGRVVEYLEKTGLRENTLIIFTSDNGPSYRGETGIYKAGKADLHEGGIRVPMIASWKGKIESGIETDQLSNTTDILPTFCDLAGVEYPENLDGVSIKDFLMNGTPVERGPMLWHLKVYKWYPQPGQKPEPYTSLAVQYKNWKLLADTTGPKLLYNLAKDPEENRNLLKENETKADSLFLLLRKFYDDKRIKH